MLRLACCLLAVVLLPSVARSQQESYPDHPDAVKKPVEAVQQAISAAMVAQLGKYYAIQLQHVHDLGPNSGALRSRALLRYEDECLGFDLFIDRSYAVDRDIRAGTTFGFALRLLTFG